MTIRVLHVLNSLGNGGAEAFIFNVYRNIDRNAIQFDFILRSNDNNPFLIDEVHRMGGNIYITPNFPKHIFSNYIALNDFFKQQKDKYKIIHVHANSLIYTLPFFLAKKYNIHCRILHSHSTSTQNKILHGVHLFNKLFLNKLVTSFFACGQEAGKWMFGSKKFKIINNAIDSKQYLYDEERREKLRFKMGLEDHFVIGHVGRFVKVKNHDFLIDIFNEIYKTNPNSCLMLIGDGELLPIIKDKVHQLKLDKSVLFLGQRQDVSDLLQVMDVFVFPSLFEGLPNALIEAQAAGLQCFVSSNVSDKAKITNIVHYLSIKNSSSEWAKTIMSVSYNYLRTDRCLEIKSNNFDILDNAKKMEEIYINMIRLKYSNSEA